MTIPPGEALLSTIRQTIPHLLALYAFGSRVSGEATPDSDLDLAILTPGKTEPLTLWRLSGDLAGLTGGPVDLLDLRAASTVMQYQIITTGQRLWVRDAQAALYESFILSEKTALDEARAPLIKIIQQEGTIHGR
ncbi:MAG: nucleotidyltransferase domain-containing protein [Magnetococcales bacterium]|nr:nucleotidyltransferase domain-containing protein [Magnetococcales bacterium]